MWVEWDLLYRKFAILPFLIICHHITTNPPSVNTNKTQNRINLQFYKCVKPHHSLSTVSPPPCPPPLDLRYQFSLSSISSIQPFHSHSRFLSPPLQFRGGRARGRRSFSDRPSTAVSGDSHFQSVRDSNFRATNNFNNNNNNYHHHNLNSSSNFGTFKSRNYSNGEYSFNRRHNQPPGARVQRPKPPDFRSWEFAKLPPPPHGGNFTNRSFFLEIFNRIMQISYF